MPKSFSAGMSRFPFTWAGTVCFALGWPVTALGAGFATGILLPVGSGPVSVVVADFNGDGKADLAIANNASNNVTVLLGDGNGNFVAAAGSPFFAGTGPAALAIADFNGDGKTDLAVVNSTNNGLILFGNGSGGFTSTGSFASGQVRSRWQWGISTRTEKPTWWSQILTFFPAPGTSRCCWATGAEGLLRQASP